MSDSLGSRLRQLRRAQSCTLSELSRRSGVGKGTISELENDRRGARLSTLFALTTALGSPLSALLSTPGEDSESVQGDAVEAVLMGRWTTRSSVVEAYRAVIGTNEQYSAPHAHGVQETVTVIDGRVQVGCESAQKVLVAGESHRYDGDRGHRFSALGAPAQVVLLMHYPHRALVPDTEPLTH